MLAAESEPRVWRKRRDGREYGSWHAYDTRERKIVNLGTLSLDEAREKARRLVGAVGAGVSTAAGVSPSPAAEPPATGARVSYLRNWAGAGPPPDGKPAPPPPEPPKPPELSPGVALLAEGMAATLAQANTVFLALGVRLFGYKAPAPSDRERKELEKTWAVGLKELMLLDGIKWWHVLLFQNGAIAARYIQDGERLAPATSGVRPMSSVP